MERTMGSDMDSTRPNMGFSFINVSFIASTSFAQAGPFRRFCIRYETCSLGKRILSEDSACLIAYAQKETTQPLCGCVAKSEIFVISEKSTPIRVLNYYSCGPADTSALPASLLSYFAKFLMKRPARSFALVSHSEASA